jgi:hypothetical protein
LGPLKKIPALPTVLHAASADFYFCRTIVVDIEQMKIDGSITDEQARLKIDLQNNAFKTVLLTEEGLGLLAVESALNAVISVIKTAVNTAVGFTLL